MNARITELATASANTLVRYPDDLRIDINGSKITISGNRADMGSLVGKERAHAKAMETLVRLECPHMTIVIPQDGHIGSKGPSPDLGVRTDWSGQEEFALKEAIIRLATLVDPKISVRHRPAVGESIYLLKAPDLSPDVVGALYVLFRAWGRRRGRYVRLEMVSDESYSA